MRHGRLGRVRQQPANEGPKLRQDHDETTTRPGKRIRSTDRATFQPRTIKSGSRMPNWMDRMRRTGALEYEKRSFALMVYRTRAPLYEDDARRFLLEKT